MASSVPVTPLSRSTSFLSILQCSSARLCWNVLCSWTVFRRFMSLPFTGPFAGAGTCACCKTCPRPAEDSGSFAVPSCELCSAERCASALPLPVGACPPLGTPGATIRATCTPAVKTPYLTVTRYMEDTCTTVVDSAATFIVDKCYTRVDASSIMERWGCSGRQATHTQWAPAFGMPISPNCVDTEGFGPLSMGGPGGACLLGTTGDYIRAEYSGGEVCPGHTPPNCGFNHTTRQCDDTCPEL
jgi:hypothetical protein